MSGRDRNGFLDSLDKENTCLGYTKSRPLTASALLYENVSAELFLPTITTIDDKDESLLPLWWRDFKSSFDHSLVMDRHLLVVIDSNVCIGSIDEGVRDTPHAIIDTLRLILAQKLGTCLDFRELPVSLLRLYFAGQQRLRRFITRMPNHTLRALHHIISLEQEEQQTEEDEYKMLCESIERYLITLMDTIFCSFERSLLTVVRALHLGTQWCRFNLNASLDQDPYWANIPRPVDDERRHCIWLTCVWRINATLLIERYLKPWETEKAQEWIHYRLKLFRASHLDLMSAMVKYNVYDDQSLLRGGTTQPLFWQYYPACTRICCAEEMPDFVKYTTDNFKTGSELKERSSLEDMFGHLFVNKTAPNICKIRNSYEITTRYGEEYPILYDILKNVLKCVLLGNLPHARGELNMVALMKINLSFEADEADAILTEAEWLEKTKDKTVKRQRSKKKSKDELIYVKTPFKLWLLLCRHFGLFLLKEYLFYIADTSGCFNEMLSVDYKFLQYKKIVMIGNGRCRNELARQALSRAWHLPFDWSIIEYEKKSKVTYDIKSGEIKKFHAWALSLSRKVWKGNFMEILAKKMTNTEDESATAVASTYVPFYYIDGKEEPSKDRVISLLELHLICWCMSKNPRNRLETRWFQVMGMSSRGVETIREWLFHYEDSDIADHSYKKLITQFQAHSMKDYMILKTVLKLIDYYRSERIFHLPINYAKRQIYALRNLLHVEEWEPTPPLLGFVYQCPGCHKYANTIVEPLDTRPRCPLHGAIPLLYASSLADAMTTPKKKKNLVIATKKKKKNTTGNSPKAIEQNTAATSCFLNMAFYNMHNTGLYCSKYSTGYKHALAHDDTPEAQTRIIMRRRDRTSMIRSNKTLLLYDSDTAINQHTNIAATSTHTTIERQTKKDQWLLEIRAHEFNPEEDDAMRDFDDNEVTKDPLSSDEVNITTAAIDTRVEQQTPKKNNKRVIISRVNDAITGLNYTCNRQLQMIDFIGIIKNGKALCVECGSMTEVKNFNITNQGITCNRHRIVKEDSIVMTHQQQPMNDKYELHPLDVVRKDTLGVSPSHCIERELCSHCGEGASRCRITVIGHRFKLIKVSLCRVCFELCRCFAKQIVTAKQLLSHLKDKRIISPTSFSMIK